jgi:hypothetical protein
MTLSEEQMKFVAPQMAIIGYVLANYEKFGDEALKVAQKYFYALGKSNGQSIKQQMSITKTDAAAVATVMNVALEQTGGFRGTRVEGNKVIGENTGFCPIMEAVRILNAPWKIVCKNYSWRLFEGLAAAVNPNVSMEVPESRIEGNNRCFHIITVPK